MPDLSLLLLPPGDVVVEGLAVLLDVELLVVVYWDLYDLFAEDFVFGAGELLDVGVQEDLGDSQPLLRIKHQQPP